MVFRRSILAVSSILLVLNVPTSVYASTSETVDLDNTPEHRADVEHFGAALQQSQEDRWWAWAAVQEWNKAVAANAAQERAEAARQHSAPRPRSVSTDSGGRHYICPQFASSDNPTGDFAVPCYIIDRESDGGYQADNPHSSAYGAYQIMHLPPGTPPAEQDAIARGMALCNWNPPNYCAGG